MEVFIRGVPKQAKESSLNAFFKDVLSGLQIEDWACQKFAHQTWAKIIFLNPRDGLRLLNLHGPGKTSLMFRGNPLHCSLSNRLDQFALRSLAMDKKAREEQNLNQAKSNVVRSERDQRMLLCTSTSCGLWDFVESELVFKPYFTLTESATLTFNARFIVIKLDTGHHLDLSYYGTESVAWEGLPSPAITFTLREAPRFFEHSGSMKSTPPNTGTDTIVSLMENLLGDHGLPTRRGSDKDIFAGLMEDLFGVRDLQKRSDPDRRRLPALSVEHQNIAGSCLVYRFLLGKGNNLEHQIRALGQARGLPAMIRRHISVRQPTNSYATEFSLLLERLKPNASALPFAMAFQLQKLAQNGYLPPSKVIDLIQEVKDMSLRSDRRVCVNAIRKLFLQIPFAGPDAETAFFELKTLVSLIRENERLSKLNGLYLEEPVGSEYTAVIHKVTVTPAGVYLYGPDVESNNRVLRKYSTHHDHFLRVQFCDEDGLPVFSNAGASNKPIYDRFRKILKEGLHIAGHLFSFLGFSHSSLRAQSCWFMAPFQYNGRNLTDRELIEGLGNFSNIRSAARCAARIGQAFSDTQEAITLGPGIVREMPDVERCSRVFSDGVGTISMEALEQIWDGLLARRKEKPTVLQIRYQGAKGMLSLDSRLKGKSVFLRPSMIKFRESNSTDLEICTAGYRPLPLYLNQPMIKILEDMGVEHDFFMNLQAKEIERLQKATTSAEKASKFLKTHSVGDKIDLPWALHRLCHLQLSFQDDSFLTDVVEAAVLIELRALKYKARIPVKDGYTLLGIMDETGILEEGQIFCIVEIDGKARVITGNNGNDVIITRSPALHPGDIQLATAVTVPEESPLMQLRNCICFSQKGSRDLPSKLSGGDLDGDNYHILFDTDVQPKWVFSPADYARPKPDDLSRPVNRQDMTDFFVKFMETDQLGRICNAHKILADQSNEGVRDHRCVQLAEMASIAVDFSKTGTPVDMDQMPKFSPYRPHFMAPGPHVDILKDKPISFEKAQSIDDIESDEDDEYFAKYKYYPSDKILGKLYSAIDEHEVFRRVQQNRFEQSSQKDETSDPATSVLSGIWDYLAHNYPSSRWVDHLDRARGILDEYEESLLNIMFEYGQRPQCPLSEVEVFVGNILGKTGAQTKRQRELSISMKERFEANLSFTVKCITKSIGNLYDGEDGEEGAGNNGHFMETGGQALALSMACLWVVLNDSAKVWKFGKRGKVELRSFGYVAAAVCLKEAVKMS